MLARRRSCISRWWSMPCLPRKSNLMRLPSMRVCRLRSVVRPKLLLSRAYSSLPTRARVFSSSVTKAASTRRRGRSGSARSRFHLVADLGQHAAEHQHAAVFRLVPHDAPAGVVAVLLAAAGVPAGRLEVAVAVAADPHVGVGRRDRELADAGDLRLVGDGGAIGLDVVEPTPRRHALDAGLAVGDVVQLGGFGGLLGFLYVRRAGNRRGC